MLSAITTRPPIANTSLHAFAAAIAPKSDGIVDERREEVGGRHHGEVVGDLVDRGVVERARGRRARPDRPTSASSRTNADSGAAPHFAAQPPHDVHSVSRMSHRRSRSVIALLRSSGARTASTSVDRNASSISAATTLDVSRRPSASTFASFHRRAPAAVSASVHRAARTPGTLFAAMLTPVPVQQQTTPRSQRPERDRLAHPTARLGPRRRRAATISTSWPRSARRATMPSVSRVSSSVPKATRIAAQTTTVGARHRTSGPSGKVGAMARRVAVVPHTHWDREWYSPFQTFRLRLVDLLDDLLPRLEADPSYAHFLLDGQMAVVDDYLAVRPEAEDRLRRLAATGRVAMGPWYILMDEFLVSGETIIRDLQLGLERAAALRRCDAGRVPARHVRPRRADAPDPPPVRLRPRGRVARRAQRGRPHRVLVVEPRRQHGAGRVPADRLRQRRRAARRRQGLARATARLDRRAGLLCIDCRRPRLDHERLRPPRAAGLPRAGRRRGERAAGRARHRSDLARPRTSSRRARDGPADVAGRAALGRPRQPPDGSGVEPRRRASRRGDHRARARAARRAAERAAPAARRVAGVAARPSVARGDPQRRPRLDLRVLGRRGVRQRARPVRPGAPDRRGADAASGADARREPRACTGPVAVNPSHAHAQRPRHDHWSTRTRVTERRSGGRARSAATDCSGRCRRRTPAPCCAT